MKTAMTAIIRKDFRGVAANKQLFTSLLVVPLVLTVLLPSVFTLAFAFAPEDPDVQKLLELLPPAARGESLELTVAGLLLNFILPVFFLIIPIMTASVMAASAFVGEKEKRTLETLLERYQALSENLTVEKVDPVVSPTFLEQYDVGSVYNNSLIVESEARYRYVDYYDIYEYDYTNYYTTGSVDMNFAGEGAITSAVSYVVNDDLPKVYTLTGHGEGSLSSDFQSAAEQDNVEFEELSLLSAETVPEDADCVLILAPQSDIADVELTALQAYLDGGGRLLLITDPPQEGAELTNLETLMAGYGVHAADGIVVEEDQANYAMGLPYTVTREVSTVTDEEGEESQEVAYLLDGAEVEFQDLLDDLNAMASTGSAVGLTPERSAQISFTFHRNTETFPQVELVFYQYDSSNCLVSLDGEVVLLATREDVEAVVEAAAALIPEA